MIVVAIMGIIAMIAIPSYQDKVLKSQVNRAVSELGVYKSPFEVQVTQSGMVANDELGYSPSDITTGSALVDIGVANPDGSGHIEVTMGGRAHSSLAGLVIRFQRSAAGEWSCLIDSSALSDWHNRYKPDSCSMI